MNIFIFKNIQEKMESESDHKINETFINNYNRNTQHLEIQKYNQIDNKLYILSRKEYSDSIIARIKSKYPIEMLTLDSNFMFSGKILSKIEIKMCIMIIDSYDPTSRLDINEMLIDCLRSVFKSVGKIWKLILVMNQITKLEIITYTTSLQKVGIMGVKIIESIDDIVKSSEILDYGTFIKVNHLYAKLINDDISVTKRKATIEWFINSEISNEDYICMYGPMIGENDSVENNYIEKKNINIKKKTVEFLIPRENGIVEFRYFSSRRDNTMIAKTILPIR